MKITIEGSPKELAELISALPNGAETEAKKPCFPPLLTELAEDEKINELAKDMRPVLEEMNERAKQHKENAPQVEAAEQETKMIVDMLSTMNSIAHSNPSHEK